MKDFLKTSAILASLMAPYLWLQFSGPHPGIVLSCGALVLLLFVGINAFQTFLLQNLTAILVLFGYPLLMIAYELFGVIQTGFPGSTLLSATTYALFLGLAFAKLERKVGLKTLICSIFGVAGFMVIFSLYLIYKVGPENVVGLNENGTRFLQSDASVTVLGIFSDYNTLFWIVALTTISASSIGIVVLRTNWFVKAFLLAMIAGALYCNYITATRTVLLTFVVTVVSFVCLLFCQPSISFLKKLLWGCVIVLGTFCFVIFLLKSPLTSETIVLRFSSIQDDTRFELWKSAIPLVYNNPFGGGSEQFTLHKWAHNHLLDVGLVYGWPCMIDVFLIYLLILGAAWKAIRSPVFGIEAVPLALAAIGCTLVEMTIPRNLALFTFLLALGILFRELTNPAKITVRKRRSLKKVANPPDAKPLES